MLGASGDTIVNLCQEAPFPHNLILNQHYTGAAAEALFDVVARGMDVGGRVVAVMQPPQAVRGMGGVGKSEAAKRVCLMGREKGMYPDGIFWWHGDTISQLHASLRSTAHQIPAVRDTLSGATDINSVREALMAWLSDRHRVGVLIVVDNVDDVSRLQMVLGECVPVSSPRVHVIVTTRLSEDQVSRACPRVDVESHAVGCLSQSDAETLLWRCARRVNNGVAWGGASVGVESVEQGGLRGVP
jgi:hypothetical protein